MRAPFHRTFAVACLLIGVSAVSTAWAGGYRAVDPPRAIDGLELVAKSGPVDKNTLSGHWTFLLIGYTSCPDICPTILTNLAAVRTEMLEKLPPTAVPKVLFVSVDPGRDTPDYLADYAANFGKGFVGATARKPVIDTLVKSLGAFYRLGRKDKDGFYLVSHSAEVYLLGPDARLRARFMPPLDPKQTLADFLAISQVASPRADAGGTINR